jgi:hypothetical protein
MYSAISSFELLILAKKSKGQRIWDIVRSYWEHVVNPLGTWWEHIGNNKNPTLSHTLPKEGEKKPWVLWVHVASINSLAARIFFVHLCVVCHRLMAGVWTMGIITLLTPIHLKYKYNKGYVTLWPCHFTLKSILRQKKKNYGNSNISRSKNIIFKQILSKFFKIS